MRVSIVTGVMLAACTIIGLWLVAYVLKQALFGRERFGGTESQYWRLYIPIFSFHMMCAVSTIGLGVYNLYMGLTRLRQGTGMIKPLVSFYIGGM